MKTLHLWIGILGLISFLATGQYMDIIHNHLQNMADAPRMLYRSAHIYLLLSASMNLIIGIYSPDNRNAWTWPKYLLSAIILLLPFTFLTAFFQEPLLENFERPYTRLGIYLLFFALGINLIMMGVKRLKSKSLFKPNT